MRRLALLALGLAGCMSEPPVPPPPLPEVPRLAPPPDLSELFFGSGMTTALELVIERGDIAKLRAEPRTFVRGVLREEGAPEPMEVAVKLKGAAGSFRTIDDRPCLTVSVAAPGRTWHGMRKFHLNNSVQDESCACEFVASRIMASAGVPATRVAHARVRLNGRGLGLYVLKEGFDKPFLARHFKRPDGVLYDGGFVQDIDAPLERDQGEGPEERRDLQALVAACREPDPARRRERIAERLDVERFLSMMAAELMLAHWDGYAWNRNNYRVYFDPGSAGRAVFLPHGMDQLFQDPGFSILATPNALVASAVMGVPEWRKRYRERVGELLPLFEPARLHALVDEVAGRLPPARAGQLRDLKNRMTARWPRLQEQHRREDPKPLEFDESGVVRLADWNPVGGGDRVAVEEAEADGRRAYAIRGGEGEAFAASWRRKVILGRGVYVLEASAKTEEVAGTDEPSGTGAGVRLSGRARRNHLTGTADWTPMTFRFVVGEAWREVELVLELRATAGSAWFDRETVLLRKVK